MDGGASQINNKHMIFCHKLGKFMFKRLVHLAKCYCLKLPSPYLHNWNPLVIFFIGHSVTIQEFESFIVYQMILLSTKMGYCLLKAKMAIENSLKAETLFQ